MKKYLSRIIDNELQLRLESIGATLIVGPKWCGKTTTAAQKAKSILRLNDPDMREAYITTANIKPSNLLIGDKPRLIDEWQEAPTLWDSVRTSVDLIGEPGQYILTSSFSINNDKIHHTGTGRISRLKMYPMSLFETGESNGSISLSELFNNPLSKVDGNISNLDLNDLIFAACRGGWPSSINLSTDQAKLFIAKDYLNNICEIDISKIDNLNRSPSKTRLLLRSLARNISTLATQKSILNDIKAYESMSESSYFDYLDALKRMFIIENVSAWRPNIRSKTSIRALDKKEFVDPSIAVAALGLSPQYFYSDLKTFGYIFECLCIRDLKVYSNAQNGKISYYLDKYGLEVDVVLHLDDGRYALIEIKLGSRQIDEGASHLLEIKNLLIEHNKNNPDSIPLPTLLIVLTGGPIAYTRPDGVHVVPIGCLKN